MKQKTLTIGAIIAMAAIISLSAFTARAVSYNQDITAIFGSGNPNTGWSEDTDSASGVQVALRAKHRVTGATPNDGAGTYSFPTGTVPPGRAVWNFEFSLNSDVFGTSGNKLDDFDWLFSGDVDPSQGESLISFSPFFYVDNELGDNSTANGAGVIDPSNIGLYSVAQNSQNITFGPWLQDPNVDATYNYYLSAFEKGTDNALASIGIEVVVGRGGASVPDSGSNLAMTGIALAGLVGMRRFVSPMSA